MGRTACTEPQCLYSRAIPLLPLWAVRPVQSLSACTTVHFYKSIIWNALSYSDKEISEKIMDFIYGR
jgi:hypothetical protein